MSLDPQKAREFFSGMYEDETVTNTLDFDLWEGRLVAKTSEIAATGAQGLQALMINYLVEHKDELSPEDRANLPAALAWIKQRAVADFVKAFPQTDLQSLVEAAKEAGYDVQVMS